MQIKFHTPTSISHEHVGKSIIDNIETGVRNDNKIVHKNSEENPLFVIKTSLNKSDIQYTGIKDDNKIAHQISKESPLSAIDTSLKENEPLTLIKDDKKIAHQMSKESPLSAIETSVKENEPFTCFKKDKVVQHPTSTYLCNSSATQEPKLKKNLKELIDFDKEPEELIDCNKWIQISEDEWYKEYWKPSKGEEDTSTWRNIPSFRKDRWDLMSQSKTKENTENQELLLDAAYQQMRNERLVKEGKKHLKSRAEFEKMESNLKVVCPKKEKDLNKEWIEAVQEEIIEKEENVPAFKKIPKDNILKPEKARRRIKKPVLGQITVHCPFCKIKTRSPSSMEKHLLEIHLEKIKNKCEPDIETAKGKITKKKKGFEFLYNYKTSDNENFHVQLLPSRPRNSENKQQLQNKEEGHKSDDLLGQVSNCRTGKANLLRLRNSGNYCYSNAVVSSLLTNPHFQHLLHQADDSSDQLVSELKSILGLSTNQVIFKMQLKTSQTLTIEAGRMYPQNKKIGDKWAKLTGNRLFREQTTGRLRIPNIFNGMYPEWARRGQNEKFTYDKPGAGDRLFK